MNLSALTPSSPWTTTTASGYAPARGGRALSTVTSEFERTLQQEIESGLHRIMLRELFHVQADTATAAGLVEQQQDDVAPSSVSIVV
jgi:hypothetical protein